MAETPPEQPGPQQPSRPEPYSYTGLPQRDPEPHTLNPIKLTAERFGPDNTGRPLDSIKSGWGEATKGEQGREDPAETIERVAEAIKGVDVKKANALKGVLEASAPRISFDTLPLEQQYQLLQSFRAAERNIPGEPRSEEEARRVIENDINAAAAAKPKVEEMLKNPGLSEDEFRRKTEEILAGIPKTDQQTVSSPDSQDNPTS